MRFENNFSKKSTSILSFFFAFLVFGSVLASANTVSSSTMVFQGVLTNDGDGSYTGILPMITGSGFDIYAKDGANAVFTDAGPVIVNQLISNHDAWPSWNVDTPDWYQYSVEFEGTTWSIRNHAGATAEDPWYNDGGDGTDMAKGVPMSGSIEWNNMYASENDLGAYITGTGTAEIDDGLGGAGAWDMDWSGGSEYVPLEYPGFYVNVYSFGDGTYRVTFTPAVSDYVPSEVYVDNNDPTCNGQSPCFSSIQDAIDAVAIGGTVNVAAGTYHENVVIDKQVTIEGEDKTTTIIDGGSSGNVIEITADNAEISGFTIQNSGSDLSHIISNEAAGIALGEVSGVVVEDNIIKGNFAGIGLTGSTGNDINSNTFINNLFGIYIGSDSAPSTANVIERNDISGSIHSDIAVPGKDPIHTGDAIYLDKNCNSNTIEYNTLTGNGQNGIYAWKSGSHIIRGNTINNNQNGIQLMGSSTNTISDNTVSENSEAGLLLRSGVLSSTGSTITENSFLENAVGIVLEDDIGTSNPQSGYVDGNQINFNIIDSTIAVQTVNTPDVVYNFEENFWGESNPDFTSIISNTSKVDYTPWYLDSVMVQLSGQPTCTPGDGQEMACGITLGVCVSGTKSRTCMEDGTWGDWSTCGGINYIPAGNEGTSYDGTCLNGQDDDCDGLTDLEDSDCSYTKTIGDLRSSKSGSDGASLIGYYSDWFVSTVKDALDWLYTEIVSIDSRMSALEGNFTDGKIKDTSIPDSIARDNEISTAISSETTRATNAENNLQGQIDTVTSWGDHADAGYLTSYTETDPIFGSSDASDISLTDISNWNTAFGWGNHANAGYLTGFTESDPLFIAWNKSSGISITESQVSDLDKYTKEEVDNAITSEAALREGNYTHIYNNITAVDNSVNTERSAREGADQILQENIENEASLRVGNETGQQEEINSIVTNVNGLETDVNSLESRAVINTNGVDIYLHQGWNTFKMPWFVLNGTVQNTAVKDYLNGNYSVAKVLESIAGEYNYLAYYDGTNWHVYSTTEEPEVVNDFTEFPATPRTADYDFHIYVNSTDGARIEIGLAD